MSTKPIRAFTLVELLVVISIITLLLALLIPAISSARFASKTAYCLSNFRGLATAHSAFLNDHDGELIDVGLGHGGESDNLEVAWITTLQEYYSDRLIARSPVDLSPHWPDGDGGPVSGVVGSGTERYRKTSYGINNFLSRYAPVYAEDYRRIEQIKNPGGVVHFLFMAETGQYAAADHPHVENWSDGPADAYKHMKLNAYGGDTTSWDGRSGYGFLDGHAESALFRDVFTDASDNQFWPKVAK